MMDAMPAWILGLMMGCGITLLIQAYGRRKVKKALSALQNGEQSERQVERDRIETAEITRRLATLERIVTDRPVRLAEQIDALRIEQE